MVNAAVYEYQKQSEIPDHGTTGRGREDTDLKRQFKISGMTCANCALTIEKGVAKIQGVKSAAVNFASEKLTLELDSSVVTEQEILSTIKDLGYGAREEDGEDGTQQFKVSGMTCANCA